jgi:hypothetical protein
MRKLDPKALHEQYQAERDQAEKDARDGLIPPSEVQRRNALMAKVEKAEEAERLAAEPELKPFVSAISIPTKTPMSKWVHEGDTIFVDPDLMQSLICRGYLVAKITEHESSFWRILPIDGSETPSLLQGSWTDSVSARKAIRNFENQKEKV